MRFLPALLLFLAACSSSIDKSPEGTADASPIKFREPSKPKEGTGTSPGCDGVSARGECQQATAVYCDLDRDQVRRVDCEALGENCIVDVARGAVCDKVDEEDPGNTPTSPCSDTGVSVAGFCTSSSAVYCDTEGAQPVTTTWDCEAEGMVCGVGTCYDDGASCCPNTSQPAPEECGTLSFAGVCENGTAKWCDAVDGPLEKNCTAAGQRCETDTCADGAYCCGTVETTNECEQIGYAGVCSNDKTVRYCSQDKILNLTCLGNKTCQVDACTSGAGCCAPPKANECTTIGNAGLCKDANTVRFCIGTTNADIQEESCSSTETCEVDTCGYGAFCCDKVDPCADLDGAGTCDGNTLKYCTTDGVLHENNCSVGGQTCEVDTCFSGYAECCS